MIADIGTRQPAGSNGLPVHQDRAGAACALAAGVLGAGESQILPEDLQQAAIGADTGRPRAPLTRIEPSDLIRAPRAPWLPHAASRS
jgi:hypothetical protein